jgi:uncharacterized protein YaeQ
VALTATIYNFDIELANVDRGVYETFALKVAQHPSETNEYLLTRVLAYCLEYAEGIAFSRGLAEPDEPPITVRDLTGALKAWIEVGAPDADRLHKASKASPRVAVYTHKDPAQLKRALAGERIHKSGALELYAMDRALLGELVALIDRRVKLSVSMSDGQLYVTMNGTTIGGTVERFTIEAA